MRDNLDMLRNLQELQRALGRSGNAQARLKTAEANLKLAEEPPRQFSPETRAEVAAYLNGGGTVPPSLSAEDGEKLEQFKKLSDRGVQFVEPPLQLYQVDDRDGLGFAERAGVKTTPPECAFLKLIAYRFHTPENQIHFCTMREGMLSTATLRPEYLAGLNFFLDQSLAGETFYKKTDQGYQALEGASEFVSHYKDDPEAALVKARPGDLAATARALESDGYLPFREARQAPAPPPAIAEGDTQVVVGGVLLRKRQRA